MNLKEEIEKLEESPRIEPVEKYLYLFKRWALEMVEKGIDTGIKGSDWEDSTPYEDDEWVDGYNSAKHEIRQRIEESTK